jgi:hypothetical protein
MSPDEGIAWSGGIRRSIASSSFGREDPMRVDLLTTLAEIMFEQRDLERAGAIRREILEHSVRHSGANHPSALAVQADLAAVLFELGKDEEAAALEREAFEIARTHLRAPRRFGFGEQAVHRRLDVASYRRPFRWDAAKAC